MLALEQCAADISCFAGGGVNEKRVHGLWKMWSLNAFCVKAMNPKNDPQFGPRRLLCEEF